MYQATKPDFVETLDFVKKNVFSNLYSHNIGKIVKFYPDTQTADVQLMQVKKYNGQLYPATLLSKIPVCIYGSSDAQITLPDLTNTICVILTFDRNISAFMKTGERYEPDTSRRHNITDSIALTTFFTLNNPIQNYDTDAITLRYKAIISSIVYYSVIQNFGNKILLKSTQNVGGSPETHGQIQIADKINISNTATDLLTVLNGLIDVIKNIKTTQGTLLHADSKAALEGYKSTIGKLLN